MYGTKKHKDFFSLVKDNLFKFSIIISIIEQTIKKIDVYENKDAINAAIDSKNKFFLENSISFIKSKTKKINVEKNTSTK